MILSAVKNEGPSRGLTSTSGDVEPTLPDNRHTLLQDGLDGGTENLDI